MSSSALSAPVALAYESANVAEFETRLFELLKPAGFDVAFTHLRGLAPTTLHLDARTIAASMQNRVYESELMPLKQVALAGRGVAVDSNVFDARARSRTHYFRDLVAPHNGKHTLMAYFSLRGEVIGGVMLGRTGANPVPFSDRDIAFVENLLPTITIARASFGVPGFVSRPLLPARFLDRLFKRDERAREDVFVRDRNGHREMVARDPMTGEEMVWTRSFLDVPSQSGWPYVDLFHLAASLASKRERALFLGCGGAVAPRQFAEMYPGIAIDIVEPNAHVLDLARAHYALDEIPHTTVHEDDGVRFLLKARSRSRWDVIVVDAYDASDLVRDMTTSRFFEVLHSSTSRRGAFAFNAVGALDGSDPIRTVTAAASKYFRDVRIVPVMTSSERYFDACARRNVVIIGTT